MSHFSTNVLLEGTAEPAPPPVLVHAGRLTALFETGSGFLRHIRFDRRPVLLGIYVALRDRDWKTVPPLIETLHIEQKPDEFEIRFEARCRRGEIDFRWTGHLHGTAEGAIRYQMNGRALSTFHRNRIGFCILHGIECAGKACRVRHADGTREDGCFPESIAPHPPFRDIAGLTHFTDERVEVTVDLEGDVFEMEDQRNWTDASFKTYAPSVDLPVPVRVSEGTSIQQAVRLSVKPVATGSVEVVESDSIQVDWNDTRPMTPLGLQWAAEAISPGHENQERLQMLKLDHLRVDLKDTDPTAVRHLEAAARTAEIIGTGLHVALIFDGTRPGSLEQLAETARPFMPSVRRWLILQRDGETTPTSVLQSARRLLKPSSAPITGGTDAFFAALNRNRPEPGSGDAMAWSINPQVHAFDNLSLVETLTVQRDQLATARTFWDGPMVISPVTFKMRWNPDATGGRSPKPREDTLPDSVDVRQMSLFGAVWTLGSLSQLLGEEGLAAVTYFQSHGWEGVMEVEGAGHLKLPHKFHSRPDMVYPLYHVFAELAGADRVVSVNNPCPQRWAALGVRWPNGDRRLLVGNLTREPQEISVRPGTRPAWFRQLDETTVLGAMKSPSLFHAPSVDRLKPVEGRYPLSLRPYGIALLTW